MTSVGIERFGGYLPAFRLDRGLIAESWGRGSLGGERTVANNDEDAVTMAVEAGRNALGDMDKGKVEGLFFATTSPVYKEKMNAALLGAALDLRREIATLDFAHSLRSGTGALKAALDAVGAGSMQTVLVTAADCRLGYPRSDQEQAFGDGAAALLVGPEAGAARFEGAFQVSHEMMDVWRNPEDAFVRTWESRFILGEGFMKHVAEAVEGLLKRMDLTADRVARLILPAPDLRTHKRVVKRLGFNPETQVSDPLISRVGHCGAAHPLLMLAAALDTAAPGDLLLLAAYGDGTDALLFRAGEKVRERTPRRTLEDFLEQKIMLPSYARFLSYKGIVETVPGEPFRLIPSATVTWRDRNSILRCHGSKCRDCGTLAFPVQRVCYTCNAKDRFDEVRIAEMEGEVFTFTRDNLAGRSDDPVVVQTVAEFGTEKVRFYGMMTDCVPSEIRVGTPVGLTFRRIYEGAGMHNYFWKCRPLRIGGGEV
ncbi:MAG: 3-hydroxy-3-methylglutaryl CoA synthase [Deltaproteobacteria bacterium]|nr:3-hydroxy-3-methylglutaryl CoA synthase [Deltaproteobacteria bacterium]MBW1924603.1 3-hydroxy-3-methylglutaryl CoA synthase [Deltaproteobacteria bacterium]MBW1950262.1 3-hydroxy-3-methylglutaryl CoA synthase [Deltaproteobacteria bacterium]MBW2009117.1 3-hydroxy-3-methylglutaryl CoA synthase [Deltaproteobacteria bacterium]MBW2346724.1 3-hydroxy-3-methylglutaryl CoA synthase [Deltaproteobacteria bacterium]